MKAWRKSSSECLKRVIRHLRGALVWRTSFGSQSTPEVEEAFCDSDRAGDPISRAGMAVLWVLHL
eukprot:15294243-Heterocapsa_arctica.AAC.1